MTDTTSNAWLIALPLILSFVTTALASVLLFLAKRQHAMIAADAASAAATAASAAATAAATAASAAATAAAIVVATAKEAQRTE